MISLLLDYDSDEDPPCLPGVNSGSDSEDDEKNGRPAAKTSRPGSSAPQESDPLMKKVQTISGGYIQFQSDSKFPHAFLFS